MISYYELLTRIKEGNIPKKIKYRDQLYYADNEGGEFSHYYIVKSEEIDENTRGYLLENFLDEEMFEPKIEIIEEYKPFEDIIEKLNIDKEHNRLYKKDGSYWSIKAHQVYVYETLNKIIDYLNKGYIWE